MISSLSSRAHGIDSYVSNTENLRSLVDTHVEVPIGEHENGGIETGAGAGHLGVEAGLGPTGRAPRLPAVAGLPAHRAGVPPAATAASASMVRPLALLE
jgi:hypothetical protein